MQVKESPAQVADAAARLGIAYNGEQPAIVRAGVVRFPALALFTILNPGQPEHGATFSLLADHLTPDTLTATHADTCRRFRA